MDKGKGFTRAPQQERPIYGGYGLDVQLETRPHYSDSRFKPANGWGHVDRTVYGAKEPGLHYDYNDRIVEWDYEKSKSAWAIAKETGAQPHTARLLNAYLSAYFDKPVVIRHIIAGVNRSNGWPFCVYGYKDASCGS